MEGAIDCCRLQNVLFFVQRACVCTALPGPQDIRLYPAVAVSFAVNAESQKQLSAPFLQGRSALLLPAFPALNPYTKDIKKGAKNINKAIFLDIIYVLFYR